jgi:hypothetical protein
MYYRKGYLLLCSWRSSAVSGADCREWYTILEKHGRKWHEILEEHYREGYATLERSTEELLEEREAMEEMTRVWLTKRTVSCQQIDIPATIMIVAPRSKPYRTGG